MKPALKTFAGGTHPPEHKERTRGERIRSMAPPELVRIPLRQNVGLPPEPVVQVGERVLLGQVIAEPRHYISAPLHASVAGTVRAVAPLPHPSGRLEMAIEIESDGSAESAFRKGGKVDYESLTDSEIRKIVLHAGIVGLGGAGFPTHVKITPPEGKTIDAFLLNGAECEPYLSADHRLMLERPEDVVEGVRILKKAVGAERAVIALEANKLDAYQMMRQKTLHDDDVAAVLLKVKYPQGAEKQLIKAVLNREVPSGGLPSDVGVIVQNVGTAFAVCEAANEGKPLFERVVTVAGSALEQPSNLWVRVGTLVEEVLAASGGLVRTPAKILMGGPMMGDALPGTDVPVLKGTSSILVLSPEETWVGEGGPCIRCGRCVRVCPMSLQPAFICLATEYGRFELAAGSDLADCIECGSCAFVCPTKRPLVHLLQFAKAEWKRRKKE